MYFMICHFGIDHSYDETFQCQSHLWYSREPAIQSHSLLVIEKMQSLFLFYSSSRILSPEPRPPPLGWPFLPE